VAGFSSSEIASVGGRQEVAADESEFGRRVFKFMGKTGFLTDYIHKAGGRIIPVKHNPSCNSMYRKSIFLKLGGFWAGFWPGEDVELDYRLRRRYYAILFNPAAIVYHYRPDSYKKFLQMMYRYGWAQGVLVNRYGLFRKIHFLPIFSILLLSGYLSVVIINKIYAFWLLFALVVSFFLYFSDLTALALSVLCAIGWQAGFLRGLFGKNN